MHFNFGALIDNGDDGSKWNNSNEVIFELFSEKTFTWILHSRGKETMDLYNNILTLTSPVHCFNVYLFLDIRVNLQCELFETNPQDSLFNVMSPWEACPLYLILHLKCYLKIRNRMYWFFSETIIFPYVLVVL